MRSSPVRLLGRGLGSGQDCRGLRQSQAFRKPFASWRVADEWLKEAFPVRGSWADEWPIAASQGQFSSMPSQASSTAFLGISPADAVTTQDAIWFLRHEEAAWYGRFHPRGPFRTDITGGVSASSQRQFHWPYFVQGREWYRQRFLGEFSITAFEVAWSNRGDHAVFLGQRNDGRMFTVNPRAHHQAAELSWDTDDIAEI